MTPCDVTSEHRRTVVVVGNGMVGFKLCERLNAHDSERTLNLVVFGDEPRPAYDRVQLTRYLDDKSADELGLASRAWYSERGIDLRTHARVTAIDRANKAVATDAGDVQRYDQLVLATGSAPFVPPLNGVDLGGVFVYRTIEDLDAIRDYAQRARRCTVLGGGLLGLEAARAVQRCGLEVHVVEVAPRLMPRQVDDAGGRLLARQIEAMGVRLHLGVRTAALEGHDTVSGLGFSDGTRLATDMVVISAGIRPRDELARTAGLDLGERGGVVVGDDLRSCDPAIFAIGEVAVHRGFTYGLVGPGYQMAEVAAQNLLGGRARFDGADLSTKLKLLGVDVASIGEPLASGGESDIVYQDFVGGVYKRLVISPDDKRLLGAILVGDAGEYARLLHLHQSQSPLPDPPHALLLGGQNKPVNGLDELPGSAQICSCNDVSKLQLCRAIREGGARSLAALKTATAAGTGCGGCVPMVGDLLATEMKALGEAAPARLCEHFAHTRQELFDIIRVKRIRRFDRLIREHGTGEGCEICKPTVASIFASVHNDMILESAATLQDTNDRFLANIQRQGTYSVVPRVPGGEITPDKLIRLGEIAKKYQLYTKITGGQRIDMFGARLHELPHIWEELVDAGFESGHAYGKAMRTVKSCVGSTWCRYGVQDSVGMAIRIEQRYRGIRAPHKLKSAVSGCIRECAEAQSKDFGVIATDKGYNLYVCGNGGAKPCHADLLARDLDGETLIRYLDRFLMYYIRTADKLTRTSVWLEKLDGGIEHVRAVVVDDSLGLARELEAQMQALVEGYQCEWAAVVRDPAQRARFRHFANSEQPDQGVVMVPQRDQHRPADWPAPLSGSDGKLRLPQLGQAGWVDMGPADSVPTDGGVALKHGTAQIAVFYLASRDRFYAVQNMCPHRRDMVLARGIVGDRAGEAKVACPMHKKVFSLETGACLSGEDFEISTFPVKVANGRIHVQLPPADQLPHDACPTHQAPASSRDGAVAAE